MQRPEDWIGRPGINDVYDLAVDDPARCPAVRGVLVCNRPAGHDAAGFGHFDAGSETVWWPDEGALQ